MTAEANNNLRENYKFWLISLGNSLALGRHGSNFDGLIFKLIQNTHTCSSLDSLWNYAPVNATEYHQWEVNMVQVMALCLQATSHHLDQCWTRSMMLLGIRPPAHPPGWVNFTIHYFKILNEISRNQSDSQQCGKFCPSAMTKKWSN